MNKNKKSLIWGTVFMVMCFVILVLSITNLSGIESMTPNCTYTYAPNGVGMTIGDMYGVKSLSHMSSLYALGLSKTESGFVSAELRTPQEVYITYATPMDEGIVPMNFTGGGWFSEWTERSENLAVIPQKLALSFFAADVPNGASIIVNGKSYKVCGVYKESGGLAGNMTENDMGRVYLSDDAMDDMQIAELYLGDKQGRDASALQRWVSGTAMVRLTGDTVDYRIQLKLVKSLLKLEVILCAVFLAILLFVTGGSLITRVHSEMGKKPWRIFVGMAVIAVTLFCVKLALDRLYIPSAYLPKENIFEFNFYYERFTGWLRWINTKGVYGSFDRLFALKSITAVAAGDLGVLCFCIGAFKLFVALRTRVRTHLSGKGKHTV